MDNNLSIVPDNEAQDQEASESVKADVKQWLARIKNDEAHWEPDFRRMRENMEFESGLQHDGQVTIRDGQGRYVCNLTLRAVEQKVSQLYAKNPKAEVKPRPRLNFQTWDGTVEMLQDAMNGIQQGNQMGIPNM